jgi:hypothetical protein
MTTSYHAAGDRRVMSANADGPSFWCLVIRGMSCEVQRSINEGFDVTKMVEYNDEPRSDTHVLTSMTALHIAAACGHPNVVAVIINNGASLSIRDSRGCTPMHCAVRNGELECAELLLRAGSYTTTENNSQETPLDNAVFKGDVDMVRMLLKYKANVCIPNSQGRFPNSYVLTEDIYDIIQEEEETVFKKEAFAMSHHKRLGAQSGVRDISPDMMQKILGLF